MGLTPLLCGYLGEVVIRTDEERLRAKQEAELQANSDPPKIEGEIRRRRYTKRALSLAFFRYA